MVCYNVLGRQLKKTMIWLVIILIFQAVLVPGFVGSNAVNSGSNNASPVGESRMQQTVKDMTFYLQNSTSARYIFDYSTTYIYNTTLGNRTTAIWDQQRVRMNWCLHPRLASNFNVTGNVSVVVYINTKGVSANANLYVDIYEVTYKSAGSETSTLVYSGTGGDTITSGIDSYQIDISSTAHTFKTGSSIRIYYEIQGGASSEFGLWYGNNTYDSRITFEAEDSLEIANIKTRDYMDTEKSNFELYVNNKTIKMQTNVTDPFGGYDINTYLLILECWHRYCRIDL